MPPKPTFSLKSQLAHPVAIDHHLMRYYNPSKGLRFPPNCASLPYRTVPADQRDWNAMMPAQRHAYYEEIDTIPAVADDAESPFSHWYIIHPLQARQVRGLGTEVLQDLRKWIEMKEDIYVSAEPQVGDFREARRETLGLVEKELWKREVVEVGDVGEALGRLNVVEGDWGLIE